MVWENLYPSAQEEAREGMSCQPLARASARTAGRRPGLAICRVTTLCAACCHGFKFQPALHRGGGCRTLTRLCGRSLKTPAAVMISGRIYSWGAWLFTPQKNHIYTVDSIFQHAFSTLTLFGPKYFHGVQALLAVCHAIALAQA